MSFDQDYRDALDREIGLVRHNLGADPGTPHIERRASMARRSFRVQVKIDGHWHWVASPGLQHDGAVVTTDDGWEMALAVDLAWFRKRDVVHEYRIMPTSRA